MLTVNGVSIEIDASVPEAFLRTLIQAGAMLRDADPNYFTGIYIVCGYTDLRFGIDSLAAIIERNSQNFHLLLTP